MPDPPRRRHPPAGRSRLAAFVLCLLWHPAAGQAQPRDEAPSGRVVLLQPELLEVATLPPQALELTLVPPTSVAIADIDCLPLEQNGVVEIAVTGNVPGSSVLLHFSRLGIEPPEEYFVRADPIAADRYSATLPRALPWVGAPETHPRIVAVLAEIAALRRPSSPLLDEQAVAERLARRERLESRLAQVPFNGVSLRAELFDAGGTSVARSQPVELPVRFHCEVGPQRPPGQGKNLTLGETSPVQANRAPVGWECDGIGRREFSGILFQDPICRDAFVPIEPRFQQMSHQQTLPGVATFETVTVFYGTSRRRTGAQDPAAFYGSDRGELETGTCEVTIPVDHEVGELESPGWFEAPDPAKHVLLATITPRSSGDFAGALAGRVATDPQREALVFVHGYNVSFEDAARRTAQLAADLRFPGAAVFYSWPSRAELAGYPVDEANVRWAVPHLREFLDRIAEQSGAERVHLIAHSMGNRALTEVLLRYAAETPNDSVAPAPRFTQIALVAPDIDADVFREDLAPYLTRVGQRLTLYASSKDKALLASRGVHGHPRAGDLSAGIVVASGIDTIDASDVDTSLLGDIGLGHSYFAEQPTVIDDLRMLLAGATSTERALVASSSPLGAYWKLAPAD